MDNRREPAGESEYARRQMSGLRALMALAEPETTVVPFSGPSVRLHSGAFEQLRSSGTLQRVRSPERHGPRRGAESPEPAAPQGRLGALWKFVRTDQMLRSSLYLILNYGVQAGLGFMFWIIAARLFNTQDVGRATTLFSASTFISFFGILGLNITFLRFLPITRQRNRLITAGVSMVALTGGVLSLVYILLTPVIARPISFVAHSVLLIAGFVILTSGCGVNALTDSVFIAAGRANYNVFVDGVVGGGVKIVLAFVLIGTGAYGVFTAASGGLMAAAITSLLIMLRKGMWRPEFGNYRELLKPMIRYSAVNYVSSLLNMLPTVLVPIIVLNRIGASGAAYYYVSFQLANLLFTAVYSVEQAFLVEGSQAGALSRAVLMRSARVLLALCVPAFIVVILFGHQLLLAFGPKYGAHAEGSLVALTLAVLPVAAQNWFVTILRLSSKLNAVIWSSAVYAVIITGLSWVLAPHGLAEMSLSWLIGNLAAAAVAGVAALRTIRQQRSGAPARAPSPAHSH